MEEFTCEKIKIKKLFNHCRVRWCTTVRKLRGEGEGSEDNFPRKGTRVSSSTILASQARWNERARQRSKPEGALIRLRLVSSHLYVCMCTCGRNNVQLNWNYTCVVPGSTLLRILRCHRDLVAARISDSHALHRKHEETEKSAFRIIIALQMRGRQSNKLNIEIRENIHEIYTITVIIPFICLVSCVDCWNKLFANKSNICFLYRTFPSLFTEITSLIIRINAM